MDFNNLRARLTQNGVQEKLTKLWIDRTLRRIGVRGNTSNNIVPLSTVLPA